MLTIGEVLIGIFKSLQAEFADEIAAVNQQYPAEPSNSTIMRWGYIEKFDFFSKQ